MKQKVDTKIKTKRGHKKMTQKRQKIDIKLTQKDDTKKEPSVSSHQNL